VIMTIHPGPAFTGRLEPNFGDRFGHRVPDFGRSPPCPAAAGGHSCMQARLSAFDAVEARAHNEHASAL
jgi:hypothetical protein